ncbi:MAG: lamin tail domain-containing protein [Chloroflexi bacterium]|nr:lamin tail domain-containing protein [Chloroflexota bacterium]
MRGWKVFLRWLPILISSGVLCISATGCSSNRELELRAIATEKSPVIVATLSKNDWDITTTSTFTSTLDPIPSSSETDSSAIIATLTKTHVLHIAPIIPVTPKSTRIPRKRATPTPTSTGKETPASLSAMMSVPLYLILISEFRTHGQNGAGDEFIEIFNPSGETVDIGGWLIRKSSGCGTSPLTLLTVTAGIQLSPGQHFLAAPMGASVNNPDLNFTAGIADNGGIALFNNHGIAIDKVGLCANTSYLEGSPLLPMASSSLDRSYERNPGGVFGSYYDTDNNLADFAVIVPSNPQNLSSPLTFCMGQRLRLPH